MWRGGGRWGWGRGCKGGRILQLKVRCVFLVPQMLAQLRDQGTQFWGKSMRNVLRLILV